MEKVEKDPVGCIHELLLGRYLRSKKARGSHRHCQLNTTTLFYHHTAGSSFKEGSLHSYTTLGAIDLAKLVELLSVSHYFYQPPGSPPPLPAWNLGFVQQPMSLEKACYYMWELAGTLDAMHSIDETVTDMELLTPEQVDTLREDSSKSEHTTDDIHAWIVLKNKGEWGGVIHRDLKLQNVALRMSDGKPMLIDFGLANHHRVYNNSFTVLPSYTAPEMYRYFHLKHVDVKPGQEPEEIEHIEYVGRMFLFIVR